MFLYTSFEILLYVVSIFNTSVNAKSVDFHPDYELSDQFFHSYYFWIIYLMLSKGLFLHRNLHLPYH